MPIKVITKLTSTAMVVCVNKQPKKENKKEMGSPHRGSASGLHIVQPASSKLFIVEAGSGCI
jgi:hypothetical protein